MHRIRARLKINQLVKLSVLLGSSKHMPFSSSAQYIAQSFGISIDDLGKLFGHVQYSYCIIIVFQLRIVGTFYIFIISIGQHFTRSQSDNAHLKWLAENAFIFNFLVTHE